MRRADRLFRLVEYLKARRQVVTALALSEEVEVSPRTIYRDIADLIASGVPIKGEAGMGYILDKHYVVRPLMFDINELDALVLGAQMVESWGDPDLASAARQATDKIKSILPETLKKELEETFLFSMPSQAGPTISLDFAALRQAIREKHKVRFLYRREDGQASSRQVRPLGLAFFGPVWLLLSWCEKRQSFRNFRLDRMQEMQISEEQFRDEQGKRLRDFQELMRQEGLNTS